MAIYQVDTPDGKTISIEGPDDATDDELIGIAQKTFESSAKSNRGAKPPAAQSSGDLSLPADRSSRELPDGGTAEDLIADMKKGDPTLRNAAPDAFEAIQQTKPPPPAQTKSMFDRLAEGDISGAYGNLSDLEKFGVGVGVPALAIGGYKLAQKVFGDEKTAKPDVRVEPTGTPPSTPPANKIKSRTFEAGNYGNQTIETAPKGMSAKETQIATDIKNRYGYDFNDLKNRFGLGDVPINDVTQAEMLANTVRNQEAAAAETPKPPVTETPTAPRSQAEFLTELDEKNGPLPSGRSSVSVMEEIKPAPVAETPKAPAPVSEAVPAGAVPPEEKKKGGRPSAKSMEGTTFRPDLGPGDNWLYNTAGPERRRAILAEFNDGKPAKDYKTAQEIYKKYQEKYPKDMFGPVIPVEQAKARGIKPPENYGTLGKVAKVGGVAGLAMTAAEMANAAQQSSKGNNAPLRESIFNLLGMIPGLGTAFSGATYAGGLNENEAADLARRRQMPPTITKR